MGVAFSVHDGDGGGAVESDDVFFGLAGGGFEGVGSEVDCCGFASAGAGGFGDG